MHRRRIVLTGGPGSGKTVILSHITARHPAVFTPVPEAATQVYARIGVRWDQLDHAGRRDVQRRIYLLQLEQEERLAAEHPDLALLLDRGTVDGAAYWPDGPDDYWRSLHTSPQRELYRYDAVIWLQSGAAIGCYDGSASNDCRFEDPAAALARGDAVAAVWQSHPRLRRINACRDFQQKIAAVERELLALIE